MALRITLTAAAVLASLAAARPERPDQPEARIRYGAARVVGTLENKSIDESSGLAVSRRKDDLLWTHNDSGGSPTLYAIGPAGEHRGAFLLRGARCIDWEDMASFTLDGRPYLLIADVGDNRRKRKTVTLYLAEEPELETRTRRADRAKVLRRIELRYPDGADDCEAVAVDTELRTIYLIAKEKFAVTRVLRLPLAIEPDKTAPPVLEAETIATIGVPSVTGMDISPDGRRMIVITYRDAFEYVRGAEQTWAEALDGAVGRRVKAPLRRQGEAIGYGPDGRTLWLTSEKIPTPLIRIAPITPSERQPQDKRRFWP